MGQAGVVAASRFDETCQSLRVVSTTLSSFDSQMAGQRMGCITTQNLYPAVNECNLLHPEMSHEGSTIIPKTYERKGVFG